MNIADRLAVTDVVIRYATGIDMLRWDLFRDVFTDEVEIDFSSFSGAPASRLHRDEWVRNVASLQEGFDATQHMSTNHVIEISDDHATCVSYMQATHALASEVWTLGGYYTNRLRRDDDRWRIDRCELTVTWETGDRDLAQRARARVASGAGRTPAEPAPPPRLR